MVSPRTELSFGEVFAGPRQRFPSDNGRYSNSELAMLNKIHLRVLDQEPVYHEGYGFGCDYNWSADYSYYRLKPHRWYPGDPVSYANYQAGSLPWQSQNEMDE